MNRKAASAGIIIVVIMALIMLTVLLKVLPSTLPTAATSFHNLTDVLAANTEVYGTEAAAFAGDLDTLMGWFWVLAPFILVLGVVLAIFFRRR